MKQILVGVLVLGMASSASAQTAIKGVELSPEDVVRVDRQCDSLRFRLGSSLASDPPPEPPAGETVADPSSYWADSADGMDEALARINLDTLSIRDCREAGFYDN